MNAVWDKWVDGRATRRPAPPAKPSSPAPEYKVEIIITAAI